MCSLETFTPLHCTEMEIRVRMVQSLRADSCLARASQWSTKTTGRYPRIEVSSGPLMFDALAMFAELMSSLSMVHFVGSKFVTFKKGAHE